MSYMYLSYFLKIYYLSFIKLSTFIYLSPSGRLRPTLYTYLIDT